MKVIRRLGPILLIGFSTALQAQTLEPPVKLGGLIQFWTQFSADQWTETFHYVRLKAKAQIDPQTSVLVMPVLGTNSTFTLLDAFVKRDLEGDFLLTAGQFKFVFGDDRQLHPDELKRVDYAKMDRFAFPGSPWEMGFRVEKTFGSWKMGADILQGAGPNVAQDNNGIKDVSGRLEWAEDGVLLGASYYGGTANSTGFTAYQNWLGAHVRFEREGWEGKLESIWAPVNSGYTVQLAYKTGGWEPLLYGECGFTGALQAYELLGGGLNFWAAAHTRLSLNVSLNGTRDLSGPALSVFQVEQVF